MSTDSCSTFSMGGGIQTTTTCTFIVFCLSTDLIDSFGSKRTDPTLFLCMCACLKIDSHRISTVIQHIYTQTYSSESTWKGFFFNRLVFERNFTKTTAL